MNPHGRHTLLYTLALACVRASYGIHHDANLDKEKHPCHHHHVDFSRKVYAYVYLYMHLPLFPLMHVLYTGYNIARMDVSLILINHATNIVRPPMRIHGKHQWRAR